MFVTKTYFSVKALVQRCHKGITYYVWIQGDGPMSFCFLTSPSGTQSFSEGSFERSVSVREVPYEWCCCVAHKHLIAMNRQNR